MQRLVGCNFFFNLGFIFEGFRCFQLVLSCWVSFSEMGFCCRDFFWGVPVSYCFRGVKWFLFWGVSDFWGEFCLFFFFKGV